MVANVLGSSEVAASDWKVLVLVSLLASRARHMPSISFLDNDLMWQELLGTSGKGGKARHAEYRSPSHPLPLSTAQPKP
jgi:hypothetical protein